MSDSYVRNVIEAALLAAQRPVPVPELAQLFNEAERPDLQTVRAALATLAEEYQGRGIEIRETASGFRVQVRGEFATEVARLWPERPQRYTRALLETLALIAYRQPITRAEIEQVRGVAVNSSIIGTLMERGWIRVVGHRDVPGHPEVLGTTKDFLDYFNLKSIDELPPLAELKEIGDFNLPLDLTGASEVSAGADASSSAELSSAPSAGEDAGATPEVEDDDPEQVAGTDALADSESGDDEAGDDEDASGDLRAAPGLVAAPPRHDD